MKASSLSELHETPCELVLAATAANVYEKFQEDADQEESAGVKNGPCRTLLIDIDTAFEEISANPVAKKHVLVGQLNRLYRLTSGQVSVCWANLTSDFQAQILSITVIKCCEQERKGLYATLSRAVQAGEFDFMLKSIGAKPAGKTLPSSIN